MATILLIEDDEPVRCMLRETLESAGHMVVESKNGCEGVDLYRAHPTDLVICDLVMPEKGGITVIRELTDDFPALKIITMSGFTREVGPTTFEFTKQLGAVCALTKPFELSEMLEAVQNAI